MAEKVLDSFKLHESRTHINLDSSCPPTPLVRGDQNYFPKGIKVRKTPLPNEFWRNYDLPPGTLSESCPRSSAPLHLHATPRLPNVDSNFDVRKINNEQYLSLTKEIVRNRTLPADADMSQESQLNLVDPHLRLETPKTVLLPNFKQNNNSNVTPMLSTKEYSKLSCMSGQFIHEINEVNLSNEPLFPDIFSSITISDRSDASKSETKESSSLEELHVSSNSPPCSSPETFATSTFSQTDLREELVSPPDTSKELKQQEDSNSRIGFKVVVRVKPLDDQDTVTSSGNRLRSVQTKGGQSLVLCTRPSLKKENVSIGSQTATSSGTHLHQPRHRSDLNSTLRRCVPDENGNKHHFKLDYVLDEASTQKDTYDVTTQPLVEMTMQGYHSCLITYGSPGSGKSHALFGKASSGKYKGLIIRAADVLVASIEKNSTAIKKAEVSMSFIQIYNEKLYDILDPSATDNIKFHDSGDAHTLEGVTEWPIKTTEDVTKQLRRNPNRLRDTARSHTIFTLVYRKEEELASEDTTTTKKFRTIEGRLDFVDLVGVNRTTKHSTHDSSGNNATAKANKSLQVFSRIIWTLTGSNGEHTPPYKDSRLTRLLREALGGNCVTRLLVTASSCPNSAHETLGCLLFAKRAMGVKNFPAPYVSVEEIVEEKPEETPVDNKVALVKLKTPDLENQKKLQTTTSSKAATVSQPTSPNAQVDKGITMVAITSPTSKEKSVLPGALPPINMKTNTSGFDATNEVSEALHEDANPEAEFTNMGKSHSGGEKAKSGNKRNLSGDCIDTEQSEGKRKSEKSKKSKKKSKSKPGDKSNSSTQYWQINNGSQDASMGSNVVTLPQIETPDQSRHEFVYSDVMGQEGKHRRRSLTRKQSPLTEAAMITNFKERLLCSRSPTPNQEDNSLREIAERKEAFGSPLLSSAILQSSSLENCCSRCHEREEKIKRDYDRMILFSKKDRDVKQSRIEELEVMLQKNHSESAPLVELQRLSTEKVKDAQMLKKQKDQIENYKAQLSTMVTASEFANLQESRRKDLLQMEEQKKKIDSLMQNLNEQTTGASKMLAKKTEQNLELSAEITRLKKAAEKQEEEKVANINQFQLLLNQVNVEKDKAAAKHQTSMENLSLKLTCAQAQISQLQEAQADIGRQHEHEKENMNREMSTLTKQISDLSKSKKKHEDKNRILPLKCDSSMNTEDIRSKLSGIACSVQCLRCAAQQAIDEEKSEEESSLRDAEIRILLMQDTKNRELLLQLKRERNLLRDVMKIMYCRQWFTDEGNPHIKRTLRRVGIDTRELILLKKD